MEKEYKFIFSIISTLWIFIFTNNPNAQKINLQWWEHEEGKVCDLGVYSGQAMIIIGLIQSYLLYINKYYCFKNINIMLLIIGSLLTLFLNYPLFLKLIPGFILQFLIIY